MPYLKNHLAQLETRLPPIEETQARVRAYVARADMTLPRFAQLIGYSKSAVSAFLNGRYTSLRAGTDLPIREAMERTMATNPVGDLTETAEGKLYETENVQDLRQWFLHCHAKRALAFCYGPPGSQKTFVLKHLVANFNRTELRSESTRNRAYYIYCSIDIRPRDLLAKMCTEAGAIGGASLQRCMGGLRQQLRDSHSVFVMDEAQHLGLPALEALRELYDEPPQIGILLAGSHGLRKMFDQRAAELEQWNSRIDAGIELRGVSEARATTIVHDEIPELSQEGIKRLIDRSRIQDAYSRDHRTYLSVRRLFKNIAFTQAELANKPRVVGAA